VKEREESRAGHEINLFDEIREGSGEETLERTAQRAGVEVHLPTKVEKEEKRRTPSSAAQMIKGGRF